MTWTRLSDNYTDRPEFEDMSLSACYLDVEALVYCNRLLTDGFLPAKKLPRITRSDDPEADMKELIDSGLWWDVEGGYQREWDDQMLATDIEKSRADNAERQKRFNEGRRDRETRHAAGDHSRCKPEYCSGARQEDKGNLTNALHNAPQTRPDPTRPKGERKGKATPARPKGRSATPREKTHAELVSEFDAYDERMDQHFLTWGRSLKKWTAAEEIGGKDALIWATFFGEYQDDLDGQWAFKALEPWLPEWDDVEEYRQEISPQ
jgi:hypothetical protein